MGNPSVRFDEGREGVGHGRSAPFNPTPPAYSTPRSSAARMRSDSRICSEGGLNGDARRVTDPRSVRDRRVPWVVISPLHGGRD
jgi:hypothetical protein